MSSDHRPFPIHSELVAELREMRARGLMRLRELRLPALVSAAEIVAGGEPAADPATAVEDLVRQAVERLGDEEPGRAAQYLFGLVQGTAGRRPTDLRERAAAEYGLSLETFRKEPERRLVARAADEIVRLCLAAAGPAGVCHAPPSAADDLRIALVSAIEQAAALADPGDDGYRVRRFGPFAFPAGDRATLITVDLGAVEDLRDVQVVVSSENTYLEPDRRFSSTLSANLREAASTRDADGVVVIDPVADELAAWVRAHGRTGNPHEPGVVATTSAGELSRQGVRRLFHAAVAVPRREKGGYDVPAGGVRRAIEACFALARDLRGEEPDCHSIAFPLFGAGVGGLGAYGSFSRLWPTLRAQLQADPSWHVHLTTWTVEETVDVLRGLLDTLSTAPDIRPS
jgi:O-acetyl-ADP-ribose deacetylase (regulator of RNase III)